MIHDVIAAVFPDERLHELYRKLQSTFTVAELARYECPCLPYVGRDWGASGTKRVLYIGKNPDGWSFEGFRTLKDAVEQQASAVQLAHLIDNFVLQEWAHPGPGKHSSPFRNLLLRFTVGILTGAPALPSLEPSKLHAGRAFGSLAYSNVFKTAARCHPNKNEYAVERTMADFHLQSFNTLPEEVEHLQPDFIIFATSYDHDCYLRQIFPAMQLVPLSPELHPQHAAQLLGIYDRALVVRCRHPQGWDNQSLQTLYKAMLSRKDA